MPNTTGLHPLAAEYLARLEAAARHLPPRERHELVEAIEEHLAVAHGSDAVSETEILNVLEGLGDPEEIVAEAAPPRRAEPRLHEIAAVGFLMGGAFVIPGAGWLIGVALLWSSSAWTQRQKWLGTLVVPGGLAAPLVLLWFGPTISECTSTSTGPPLGAPPLRDDTSTSAIGDAGATLQTCSVEALASTWPGILLSAALVAAALAVAIYLIRHANPMAAR